MKEQTLVLRLQDLAKGPGNHAWADRKKAGLFPRNNWRHCQHNYLNINKKCYARYVTQDQYVAYEWGFVSRISYDYHEQLQNHLSVYDCSCAKLLRKCDIWVASEHGFGEEAVVARRAWHHVPAAVSPTKYKYTLSGSKDGWQTTNSWLLGSYKLSSICHIGILMRNSSLRGSSFLKEDSSMLRQIDGKCTQHFLRWQTNRQINKTNTSFPSRSREREKTLA